MPLWERRWRSSAACEEASFATCEEEPTLCQPRGRLDTPVEALCGRAASSTFAGCNAVSVKDVGGGD